MMPNMFEFSIALRYLLPKKSQKTLSLVGILATSVISVVLWLLIVFVSITQSIETQWLSKMTALSAPLRVKPNKNYLNSYYYQIDQHAEASNYRTKTLQEKKDALKSDPFDPDVDENISHLPLPHIDHTGSLVDPVKRLFSILEDLKKDNKFVFEEYALSAGALHLNYKKEGQSQTLNQVLYLTSFAKDGLNQGSLIDEWDEADFNHLIKTQSLDQQLLPFEKILSHMRIESIKIEPFRIALPRNFSLKSEHKALAEFNAEGKIRKVMLLSEKHQAENNNPYLKYGTFNTKDKSFNGQKISQQQIYLSQLEDITLEGVKNTDSGLRFLFKGRFNGAIHHAELSSFDFTIEKIKSIKSTKPEITNLLCNPTSRGPYPVLAPRSFKEQGAKVGDKGYVSYGAKTLSGFQEMKAPVYISGFYDPGIFSVGAKVLVAPKALIDLTGTSATTYALDQSETNGVLIFTHSFKDASKVKDVLKSHFEQAEIKDYFDIQTYAEYPFVKEILEQFASDKLIFFLVGFIILSVALSNVVFFMQLLVRDKSQEMAIIRSLGASYKNIRNIFVYSGMIIGLASALIAQTLAFLTLYFIQPILQGLSFILGQSVSLSQFYGISQQVTIPTSLTLTTFILTPLLCALSACFATSRLKKQSCSEFLKEPR